MVNVSDKALTEDGDGVARIHESSRKQLRSGYAQRKKKGY
jgi:hypothetical protein